MDKKSSIVGPFIVVVLWLFIQTLIYYIIQVEKLNHRSEELLLERRRISLLENEVWNFYTSQDATPILLNKRTGESWRFFRNMKNGELENEGWTPLYYDVFGSKGVTPEIAEKNFRDNLAKAEQTQASK